MPNTAPLAPARRYTAAELERIQQAADAARRSPFWPFGERTAQQMRQVAAQEAAMRAGMLARTPEALL